MTTSEHPEARPQSLQEALGEPVEIELHNGMSHALRRKFMLAYFMIAVVAGAAIAMFVILVAEPSATPPPKWSSFKPSGSSSAEVKQIADEVGQKYRGARNQQLTIALGGTPMVGDVAVKTVAILPDTTKGKHEESDIAYFDGKDTIEYNLCGLGPSCAIPTSASKVRGLLLIREAIELSLYTFKYVDSAKAVTVILPPARKANKTYAPNVVFLRRGDLSAELRTPIARTFTAKPPLPGQIPVDELETVNRIALPNLYTHTYQLAPDQSAVLVLTPQPTTASGR